MTKVKYLILGAGPTGLAIAHTLAALGEDSFLVLEKEDTAGGLCRSLDVDDHPLDIGGGHFLDVKRRDVLDFLFSFLPESEWRQYRRVSRIKIRGNELDYPLEANLWQMPVDDQLDFLESIARAGCVSGLPMPEAFDEWIVWKLGKRIAEEYMLPYNRKIWSTNLSELGTYWLHKLPDVSFRQTLQSCLEGKASGTLPAHATFLYPRDHGYGEVWKRMGDALGDRLRTRTPVTSIDISKRIVNEEFQAETVITTIPWPLWTAVSDLPAVVAERITSLRNASIDIDYYPETVPTDVHWLYEPDEGLSHHRILYRSNFCEGSRGYWTETNSRRATTRAKWNYRNDYAYPVNTIGKPDAVAEILSWAHEHGIVGAGRWGTWEHMNSDIAVAHGMATAKNLLGK